MESFFITREETKEHHIFPGVAIHTAWLNNLMTSLVEMEPNSLVEEHQHPHEQMGIVISGRAEFTIGGIAKILGPGDMYRMPSNVRHKVKSFEEKFVAFDVFSPVRADYQ